MLKLKHPYSLIIYGPTAVGKTDIAFKIAKHIPSEIINMDVGQFYTPLSIGTAKPEWKTHSVPHHLFDIVSQPENITVAQYRELLLAKIQEVFNRGRLPIIVGGSGFYLKSILFPPSKMAEQNFTFDDEENSASNLWDQLNSIDPIRAQQIHRNDVYRIKRALELWRTTGKKPSEQAPKYNPPFDYSLIFFTRDRKELYERIDSRVLQMLNLGWLEETRKLIGTDWE